MTIFLYDYRQIYKVKSNSSEQMKIWSSFYYKMIVFWEFYSVTLKSCPRYPALPLWYYE